MNVLLAVAGRVHGPRPLTLGFKSISVKWGEEDRLLLLLQEDSVSECSESSF